MSNIIEFRSELNASNMGPNGVGVLDGSANFPNALQLPVGAQPKLQVCGITISDRIPNVYNAAPYYNFNNTLLKVQLLDALNNIVQDPDPIQLERGLYSTVEQISDAIVSTITSLGWVANKFDPPFYMTSNLVTDTVTVTMVPGKLSIPFTGLKLKVDFRKTTTGTDLATTLGFSQGTAVFTGIESPATLQKFTSDQTVFLDSQGTSCDIQSSLITIRRRNNTQVRTLAIIPFAGKNTVSDNVWPSGGLVSPILIYEGSKTINYVNFEVKALNGQPMLFMNGSLHIVLSFIY